MSARLLLLVALCAAVPTAAAQPRVAVTVTPQEPRVGDTVTFQIVTEGGRGVAPDGGELDAPDATGGLDLVRRAPTLDATTSVNGRTSRQVAWTYRATTPGEARLAPVAVRVDNRVFTTDPVRLTVRPPAATAPRAGPASLPPEAVAVRVEPDLRAAIVGQQVTVDVVLYADAEAQPTETLALGAWSTPGFWREELDAGVAVPRTVRAGGRTRLAYTVERLALFPTRAGRLTIAPRRLRVTLIRYDAPDPDDPFGSFFRPFRQSRETVVVESPAVTVDVTAAPAGAPPSFAGAVGRFTMERRVEPTAVAADEPVVVRLTLSGDGNLATLPAPTLDLPPGVDLFGPDDTRDADRLGRRLQATRTFTYTLVPSAGGRIEIPAFAWSYYDPSARRYQTLTAPAATIRVTGDAAASVTAATPALALRADAQWRRALPLPGLWAALGVGVMLPLLAWGATAVRRRRRATPTAPAPTPFTGGTTYAETERSLRRTLASRFGVSPATPPGEIAAALTAAGVAPDVAARLAEVVATCERGQYAPGLAGTPPPDQLAAEATAALALIPSPTRRRTAPAAAVLAVLLAWPAAPAVAGSSPVPAERFRTGVQLIAEGDTAGAVAAWQGAEVAGAAEGRASAAVAYNLGLVAIAQRDAARARLHLNRAARLAPLDGDVRAALAEARALSGGSPPSRAEQAWAVATVFGPAVPVALAVVLALVAAVWLARRRHGGWAVAAAATLAAVVAVAALVEAQAPRGVTVEEAVVRAGPSPDAPEAGRLGAGAAVRLGTEAAGWRRVAADDADGWIPAGAIAR